MIDRFSEATLDADPMHVDPQWAATVGPFGSTIAFGFLTMSLLTHLLHSTVHRHTADDALPGYYLNYGFDRLRLITPVKVESEVRARFLVSETRPRPSGGEIIAFDAEVEIRGQPRPALSARWLSAWIPATTD